MELKAPGGFGADMVFRPADCITFFGCFLGYNAGEDFIDTVFDDASSNDLLGVGAEAAPFTGSWLPSMNSPSSDYADPTGQLSHLNGTLTGGDWQVFVSDNEIYDTGTLDSWSLIVTPMMFDCCQAAATLTVTSSAGPATTVLSRRTRGRPMPTATGRGCMRLRAIGSGSYALPGEVRVTSTPIPYRWPGPASRRTRPATVHDLVRGDLVGSRWARAGASSSPEADPTDGHLGAAAGRRVPVPRPRPQRLRDRAHGAARLQDRRGAPPSVRERRPADQYAAGRHPPDQKRLGPAAEAVPIVNTMPSSYPAR